jgi:nucleotide-binding universal stress UspA family protein
MQPDSIPEGAAAWRRILVPYDGTAPARRALDEAIAIAGTTHARLRLIAVFDEFKVVSGFEPAGYLVNELIPRGRHQVAQALLEGCAHARACGAVVDGSLLDGSGPDIAGLVCRQVSEWKADLLVAGTHGRRGLDRILLGSVAENILRHCAVPVLLVRSPDTA